MSQREFGGRGEGEEEQETKHSIKGDMKEAIGVKARELFRHRGIGQHKDRYNIDEGHHS